MNLLLINADQLRRDCLGYMGLRPVKTPNLDRLAARGAVYSEAYAPLPVCSPARQALLCGRHPDSFGAMWNYDHVPSKTAEPDWCWTKSLADAGYESAYIGRFHVSAGRTALNYGYGAHISRAGQAKLIKEKYPDAKFGGGWLGCTSPIPLEDSATHWVAARACETMRDLAESGKPWHMWVDYEEPHLPCQPSEPFASMYRPEDMAPWDGFGDEFLLKPYIHRQQPLSWGIEDYSWSDFQPMVARYLGMVSQLDDAIGRILDCLEETGQAAKTIVVFTSDHGDMCASHGMLDKHYVLYDDIIRVPLIVAYPGAKPFAARSFVWNALDIPASVVRWLGLPPLAVEHGRPLPLCEAEDAEGRRDIDISSNGQQFGLFTARALRDGGWKYVWNLTDLDELYDLTSDPGEKRNLIYCPSEAGRIAKMRTRLRELLIAHGDPFAGNQWLTRQLLEGKKL